MEQKNKKKGKIELNGQLECFTYKYEIKIHVLHKSRAES